MDTWNLRAEFVRDPKGRLVGIREIDIIHYYVRLSVVNPPAQTQKVVYELHESYGQAKIEVKAGTPGFTTEITTYGDYEVKVQLQLQEQVETKVVELSQALTESTAGDDAPEIRTALEQIRRL